MAVYCVDLPVKCGLDQERVDKHLRWGPRAASRLIRAPDRFVKGLAFPQLHLHDSTNTF